MVRRARARAKSGFYHVVLRGNGRQIIFNDDTDRREFLRLLKRAGDAESVGIIAWCLMDNHVHLLLNDESGHLSPMVHRFASMYARYFNEKAGHVGSLFEGRFKSKAIESEAYLLQAVRYIHDNPLALGYTRDSYPWSSYREYMGAATLSDTALLTGMLGGKEGFARFSAEGAADCYVFEGGPRRGDRGVVEAQHVLRGVEPAKVKGLPQHECDRCLRALRTAGFSIRAIERLTGIGRYHINKVTSAM